MRISLIALLALIVHLAVATHQGRHVARHPAGGPNKTKGQGSESKGGDKGAGAKGVDPGSNSNGKGNPNSGPGSGSGSGTVTGNGNIIGSSICAARGTSKNSPLAYFSSTNLLYASYDRCGAHCLQDNKCLSFAFGLTQCVHYAVTLYAPHLFMFTSSLRVSSRTCI